MRKIHNGLYRSEHKTDLGDLGMAHVRLIFLTVLYGINHSLCFEKSCSLNVP